MNMKIAALLLMLTSPAWSVNYKQLAKEMAPLLDKMEAHDPAKLTMILRLADVLFEATVEVDKNVELDAKALAEISQNQKKAVELYEYALTGLNGAVAKPGLEKQYRIEFQLARLYTDLGLTAKADQKWNHLVLQKTVPQIQREAALRLAEKFEMSNKHSDIANAGTLYDLALSLCDKPDLRSYIEYRRGWISHRLGKSTEGVQFLIKSLANADASSVDEILKDLTLFLAHSDWNATRAIETLEKIGKDHKKTALVEALATNYFTADQRESYYQATQYLLKKDPHIDQYISIIEFAYSQGRLDEVKEKTSLLELALDKKIGFTNSEKQTEAEKILFRLVFQWDGERKTRPEIFTNLVNRSAVLYTKIYPTGPQYEKVTEGWLAIQESPEVKFNQVEIWRAQQEKLGRAQLVKHFYQIELALAQQMKKWDQVVAISEILLNKFNEKSSVRALTYQKAKALYELKKFDLVLPLFRELAKLSVNQNEKPDSFAIFSQNLALDILGQQKKYDEIKLQAESWTLNSKLTSLAAFDKNLAKEIAEMSAVSEKSVFAKAVSVGNKESLDAFKKFCFSGKFSPQSCDNAKVLAAKLHDQQSTIEILKHQGPPEELASELEFAGYFSDAARVREKMLGQSLVGNKDLLRLSLLFELGGELKERDRILLKLTKQMSRSKTQIEENEEKLILQTLKEASLLGPDSLALPWSAEAKLDVVVALEEKGQRNSETQKTLLKTCQDLGPSWQKIQLAHLIELDAKQNKISIVGRRSQENFKKRVSALRLLAEDSQCFLKASTQPEARVVVLSSVAKAYADFSTQIKSVALPEGLDEETLSQVKAQISSMAQPFDEQSDSWMSQAKTALAKLPILERDRVEHKYISGQWNFEGISVQKTETKTVAFDWDPLLKDLRANPYDTTNLGRLKTHFDEGGNKRLAAYFQGRIKSGGNE